MSRPADGPTTPGPGRDVRGDGQDRLVGRDSEFAELNQWLDRVAAGRGGIVLIQGEPGIGKTRMLAELVIAARQRGFVVLSGCAQELTQGQPFGAIASALGLRGGGADPARAAIAGTLRSSTDRRFRLLDDILTLVERAAIEHPVLLAVDDLHWTDGPSLVALHHVAVHCDLLPVAVAGTLRHSSPRPEVARFRRSAETLNALELRLGPLHEDAVAALVAAAAGGLPSPRLLRHMSGTGGNPLYIRELTRALREAGALQLVTAEPEPEIEVAAEHLPPSFRRLVLNRLAALPPKTVELLRVASVLGASFSAADLADAFGPSAAQLVPLLEPAFRESVLAESGDQIVFRHELVRDAIYRSIPNSVRTALHLQAGRALAAGDASAVKVATQLGLGGDRSAVTWLARASAEVFAGAPETSLELLDRALELAGPAHPDRDRLEAERAHALVWAGHAVEGAAAGAELLKRLRGGSLEPVLRHTLTHACLLLGRPAEAAEHAEYLAFRSGLSDAARAVFLGDAASARILSGDLARAAELAAEGVTLGSGLGDDLALSVAFSSQAMVAYFEARLPEALELARQAEALALRTPGREAPARPHRVWLSMCLADTERFEEAATQIEDGHQGSARAGFSWQVVMYHSAAGRMHWLAGDWDDSVAEMQTSIRVAEELGVRWITPQQWSYLACIAFHRGERPATEKALAAAERGFAEYGPQLGMEVMVWARALWLREQGELAEAARLLSEGWSILMGGGSLTQCLALGPDLVGLALATGDRELARTACDGVEEAARRAQLASAHGVSLRCRGLLEDDPQLLLDAVTSLRAGRRQVELAFACEDAGVALARHRNVRASVELIDEAIAGYRRVGARRDLARLTATLRGLGIRSRARELNRRPQTGWEALTGTERRVAALAAQGMTNPEIGSRLSTSRRTVETHLSHVFAKLEVSSRVALAAAYTREEARRPPSPG